MKNYPYIEVSSIDALPQPATGTNLIVHYVFQYIDFNEVPWYMEDNRFLDCCFLGCTLVHGMGHHLDSCLLHRLNSAHRLRPHLITNTKNTH